MRAFAILLALSGCLYDPPCTPDARRCDGDQLQECVKHPGGYYGIPPHHVSASDPSWETQASCGAGLCVATADTALCAIASTPEPACTRDGFVCDGTTLLECQGGFVMSRERCKTCDPLGTCKGELFGWCTTDADCADGMFCGPARSCQLPCDCPDGTSCAVCDAAEAQSLDPDLGQQPQPLVCSSGACHR